MEQDNYGLLDWVDFYKLYWIPLSENEEAVELLKLNKHLINWDFLSMNPNPKAIDLLKENPDKINWNYLSQNSAAIDLLIQNPNKINWDRLSMNSNAVHLLYENPDKINWDLIPFNLSIEHFYNNPIMKRFIENKLAYNLLLMNPSAYHLFQKESITKVNICWKYLSANPAAIELLEANIDKIYWINLSRNPAAIHLLEANQSKIDWYNFSKNPAIFKSYSPTFDSEYVLK